MFNLELRLEYQEETLDVVLEEYGEGLRDVIVEKGWPFDEVTFSYKNLNYKPYNNSRLEDAIELQSVIHHQPLSEEMICALNEGRVFIDPYDISKDLEKCWTIDSTDVEEIVIAILTDEYEVNLDGLPPEYLSAINFDKIYDTLLRSYHIIEFDEHYGVLVVPRDGI